MAYTSERTGQEVDEALDFIEKIKNGDIEGGIQPKLVSGENIKTYKGMSILGSGDIFDEKMPPQNEIWYTNGSTAESTEPANLDAFLYRYYQPEDDEGGPAYEDFYPANILSNTYNEDIAMWVLKFDEDIVQLDIRAFEGCSNITRIVLPVSITHIGDSAFCSMSALQRINIPSNVSYIAQSAFDGTPNLERVDITDIKKWITIFFADGEGCNPISNGKAGLYLNGELVTNLIREGAFSDTFGDICDYAFCNYQYIESILAPNGCTKVGSYAFANCFNLRYADFGNLQDIGEHAFIHCENLQFETHTGLDITIGDGAFIRCYNLQKLPRIKSIGVDAIGDCLKLERITLAPNAHISDTAFENYQGIVEFSDISLREDYDEPRDLFSVYPWMDYAAGNISFELTTTGRLGKYALAGLNIRKLILKNITTLGERCLAEATIEELEMPTVKVIEKVALYYCPNLEKLELPNSLQSIGKNAFVGCSALKSINIPDSVTTLENGVFYNCSALAEVSIGKGIATIGANMFQGCQSLQKLTIPTAITNIGAKAFYKCIALVRLTMLGGAPTLADATMPDTAIIVVHASNEENYKNATNWSRIANNIYGTEYLAYRNEPMFMALVKLEQRVKNLE